MNAFSGLPEFCLYQETDGSAVLKISGELNHQTCSRIWDTAIKSLVHPGGLDSAKKSEKKILILNLEKVTHLDTAGAVLIACIEKEALAYEIHSVKIQGLLPEFVNVLKTVSQALAANSKTSIEPALPLSRVEIVGEKFHYFWKEFQYFVSLLGEILAGFFHCIFHPGKIRLNETLLVAERAGVNALGIVLLIAFIVGLVMAFQAAIPMKMFGVEIYVANLIGIAMVRELGPLMTAIVLAGRSASAFAAEIGTMKINEELDALDTMGVDPVFFLIVPRILSVVILTPLLSLFANLAGILGGAVVILSMGYPMITYYNQVVGFVTWGDFAGGIVKCLVFGMLIAATGCIRGYQTGQGASAVGKSTTSAVVTSIILIAVSDGIFSIVYYSLGI